MDIEDGQIIVRASFPQGWRNNKYDKDEKMPATEAQARRLTASEQAYYDFETNKAPTMDNTKKEIISYLEVQGYEYEETETKAELLERING